MDDLSKSTIKVNQTSNGDEKDIDLKALETKLRHQPEYWHTARRFYAPDKDTGKRQRRGQKSGNNRNGEHWDVFTRDNLLRVRHAVGPAGGNYYYGVHSFSHDEKITVFESAEKCDSEAEKLYSSLLDDKECEEFDTFGEAYRHSSKPYWMWVLESQTDATIPCYASKIGGAPAVYLDLARQRDFYEECDFSFGTFMFQIDLSTIPERLQEYLGSNNGLLQFYNTGGEDEAGISTTLIPAEDFPLLVKGRESDSKVPVIPIAGWVEKYDFIGYSEPLEKFGGYYVDVQCEYQEIGPEKFLFESRDCSNIFHLNTGDGGNIQYFGYKNGSGGWTNFSCH